MTRTSVYVVLALLMAGCTTDPEVAAVTSTVTVTAPAVTVTETAPERTITVTKTTEPAAAATTSDDLDIEGIAMQIAWDEMSSSDRDDICLAWSMAELRPMLLDEFESGADGAISRSAAESFLNRSCG